MKKIEFCVADYDYTKTYPDIDYSERITESGLVLSMRQIYERYAAIGVDLLNGEYIDDDQDPDDTLIKDFDDPLDMLQTSAAIKSREASSRKRKKTDVNKPEGKQLKDDTPVSPKSAPGSPSQAPEPVTSNSRQSAAQRNDGAGEK